MTSTSEITSLRLENARLRRERDRYRDEHAKELALKTAYRETMRQGGREPIVHVVAAALRVEASEDLSKFSVGVIDDDPAQSASEVVGRLKADPDNAHFFRPRVDAAVKDQSYKQPNPYLKKSPHWNLTKQAELEHENYELAKRLAAEAGDPLPDVKE